MKFAFSKSFCPPVRKAFGGSSGAAADSSPPAGAAPSSARPDPAPFPLSPPRVVPDPTWAPDLPLPPLVILRPFREAPLSPAQPRRLPFFGSTRVGALCGNVHVAEPPAWITDNALMLQVESRVLELWYVADALRLRNLNELANQSAQPLITGTQVRAQRLPIPPLSEQASIVSFLSHASKKMDSSISRVGSQIALVREYRTRLIADVVIGKLDVREAAAQLPDEGEDSQSAPSPDKMAPRHTDVEAATWSR